MSGLGVVVGKRLLKEIAAAAWLRSMPLDVDIKVPAGDLRLALVNAEYWDYTQRRADVYAVRIPYEKVIRVRILGDQLHTQGSGAEIRSSALKIPCKNVTRVRILGG
uniref:Uncharacterized protein n=1 Tax=Oryza meridionalis TaxID=40149 RepID=A0A0E0DCZ0_9ORYZ